MSVTETLPEARRSDIDPYRLGRRRDRGDAGGGRYYATGHGEGGPASKRVIVGYGFWLFLLSDIVMFSAFFAAHAVLQPETAGGPSGRELFHPSRIAIETACLLASSFTCGLSAVATEACSQLWTQGLSAGHRPSRPCLPDAGGAGFRRDGRRRRGAPA
jgi:cytochrome o ubiquinol oxidase subunit III